MNILELAPGETYYGYYLAPGEIYCGHYSNAEGKTVHFILLSGDVSLPSWEAQMEWAKSIGGDLPNRIEQAMLWANHRDQFQQEWYWSNETHHSESGWAWFQHFDDGFQHYDYRDTELRARAVRRVIID